MQKILLALVCLCIFSLNVQAQDSYFWNLDAEKIAVFEKRSSLCLYFHDFKKRADFDFIDHPSLKHIKSNNQVSKRRVIFEFDKNYDLSPQEMYRQLGLKDADIKSAHWGLSIDGEMTMWLSHRVLFEAKEGITPEEIEKLYFEYAGAKPGVSRTGMTYVDIRDINQVLPLANQMYESGKVDWAQPNFAVVVKTQVPEERPDFHSTFSATHAVPVIPSDSLFGKLYYLNNTGQDPMSDIFTSWIDGQVDVDINAPEVWCTTIGSPSIKVAVIDQGVEPHVDLEDDNGGGGSRLLAGFTSDPNGSPGGVPQLQPGAHGQAVTGIIAASHNTDGVSGICPECEIIPVTAFDKASDIDQTDATEVQYLADGISWAYQNGADVLNNSWVLQICTGTSGSLYAPIETAIDNALTLGRGGLGSVVVFATGQEIGSAPYDCVPYPASLPQIIAVGAIGLDGNFTNYTNYGQEVDIVAPTSARAGQSNISVMDRMGADGYNPTLVNGNPNNFYSNRNYFRYFGGTSASSAQVSGVAALVLSYNSGLTQTQVRNLLLANTQDVGDPGVDDESGNGMLRADQVLAATPAPGGFPVEFLSFTGKAMLQRIELKWETAFEINNDYFLVEKQIQGVFRPIGRVEGNGNSDQVKGYTYSDLAPALGTNIYRLRQVDFDGMVDYSSSIEVSMDASNLGMITRMFPNPAREELYIEIFDMARKDIVLQILDLRGRTLHSQKYSISKDLEVLNIDVSSFSAGAYMIRIMGHGVNQALRKFIKAE